MHLLKIACLQETMTWLHYYDGSNLQCFHVLGFIWFKCLFSDELLCLLWICSVLDDNLPFPLLLASLQYWSLTGLLHSFYFCKVTFPSWNSRVLQNIQFWKCWIRQLLAFV